MYGRYFMATAIQNPPTYDGKNLLDHHAGRQPTRRAQSATIGDNYTFGPATLNSFHVTFNRRRDDRGPTDTPINPTLLGVNMYSAVPNFLLTVRHRRLQHVLRHLRPGHFNVNAFQVADDVDVIRGTASNGVRLQPGPRAEQHHLGLRGERQLHVQRLLTGPPRSGMLRCGLGLADFMTRARPTTSQQTNATPDDLRTWIMSFYAQDTFKLSTPNFTLNLRSALGTDVLRSRQVRPRHFLQPAGILRRSVQQGLSERARRAVLQGRRRNSGRHVERQARPTSRRASAWSGIRTATAATPCASAARSSTMSSETWFNERETTNAPVGTNDRHAEPDRRASPIPGWVIRAAIRFRQNGKAFFPTAGVYVNMPINPEAHLCGQLERHLPAAVRQPGWLR